MDKYEEALYLANGAELPTFDDVLIQPKFSEIVSRKDVDISSTLGGNIALFLPVMSSNMASITESKMAKAVYHAGGIGILHRFQSIEDNIKMFKEATTEPDGHHLTVGVSVGITDGEKERALALIDSGANIICVDVAHGAQRQVVEQVVWLREKFGNKILQLIVGNFATADTIREFLTYINLKQGGPIAFKVGIGPGSACTTRLKTGVGVPQLMAILDCAQVEGIDIIADGGMKTPGDIAKALAAGAKVVMLGGMLAGTDEAPGQITEHGITYKAYKGSASEGYGNGWKTSEGVEFLVPEKGPVKPILKDIEGGLRSAFTYVGAKNLKEFQEKANFNRVTGSTRIENTAHGRKND